MFDGKKIVQQQTEMEQARTNFDSVMRESARWFLPRQQQFDQLHGLTGNQKIYQSRIFDPYAQQALEQGIALFEGYVMPRGQLWQRWELPDEQLMKMRHVREWVEDKNRLLFRLRNDPKSGFTGQVHESIASLLGFGMQAMWPDIRRDLSGEAVGLSYQSDFVGQIFVKTDGQGLINQVHYRFNWTARQAADHWGDEAPDRVKKAISGNREGERIQFLHVVMPNRNFDARALDWRGMPWAGAFVCTDDQEVFKTGGYRAMPRIVSRYVTPPNEDYGDCPAYTVLPAVKATQQMMLDLILAAEMAAQPPLAAHSDMLDQTVRYAARQITYGALDGRGNRLLESLIEPGDMTMAENLLNRLYQLIDRAFFVDMLQIRNELKSHVTDSQLYQREEEKGILLAPLANQEAEWLSPMLDREIDLMDEMGLFDDMPGEVGEALAAGMQLLEVNYDNGLSRAQDAGAAAGYWRMLEQFTPIFQSDPASWQKFTQKWPLDKVMDHMGRINGVPASWEASEDERRAAAEADAEAQGASEMIEALPAITGAARNLDQIGAGAGNG